MSLYNYFMQMGGAKYQCQCIAKSTGKRCTKTFTTEGQKYCHLHKNCEKAQVNGAKGQKVAKPAKSPKQQAKEKKNKKEDCFTLEFITPTENQQVRTPEIRKLILDTIKSDYADMKYTILETAYLDFEGLVALENKGEEERFAEFIDLYDTNIKEKWSLGKNLDTIDLTICNREAKNIFGVKYFRQNLGKAFKDALEEGFSAQIGDGGWQDGVAIKTDKLLPNELFQGKHNGKNVYSIHLYLK